MPEWLKMLCQLEEIIDRLLDMAEEKRAVIVSGDVTALEGLVREETGLLARMTNAEEARQRSVVTYAIRQRMDPKAVTLAELLPTVQDAALREELSGLRAQLQEKLERLEQLNRRNEELLITQRDITRFMLEASTRPTQLGTQYAVTGRDADTQESISFIDMKG